MKKVAEDCLVELLNHKGGESRQAKRRNRTGMKVASGSLSRRLQNEKRRSKRTLLIGYQLLADGEQSQFQAIRSAGLIEDAGQVMLDSVLTDGEFLHDIFVRAT